MQRAIWNCAEGMVHMLVQGIGHWALSAWQIYICKHLVLLQAMLHAWPSTPCSCDNASAEAYTHAWGQLSAFLVHLCQTASLNVFVSWYAMLLQLLLYLYPCSSHCQLFFQLFPQTFPLFSAVHDPVLGHTKCFGQDFLQHQGYWKLVVSRS